MLTGGTKLGPYEIVSSLGAGGMGEVYRAKDSRLNRSVAIKVSSERFTERFEREAHAIAQLNHPNICQVYDVGPNYLVMELVEGTPLAGPLPVPKAIEYAEQILDAVDAAHRKGITHRDLKPANILVTSQGIKLLDFGLAKAATGVVTDAGAATISPLTGEGQIVGTLQYMSPEQLQGKEIDARSDLFSFGCVLYEMLTGKHAFGGDSPASVVAAVLERDAPSVASVAPSLERIVKRSLAKDPDRRFQTARDLKAALAWAIENPPATPTGRVRAARWSWVVAAALLLVGLLGGWGASRFRESSPDDRLMRFQIHPPDGGRFVVGATVGGISLSPDGRTAAYVASVNGKNGLWVQELDKTAARLLPGTEGAGGSFWSPDSRSLAYVAGSGLYRVDIAGGQPIPICNATVFRGGAWTTDGYILFGAQGSGLRKVSASGGAPTPLTTVDTSRGEYIHGFPQLLPGNRVMYWVQGGKPENTGIYSASLSNPSERIFLQPTEAAALFAPHGDDAGYLLWTRGGTLLAQPFDRDMLRLTGEPRPVADPVGTSSITGYLNATVSANGLLLFSDANTISQFVFLDRQGQTLARIGEPGGYNTFRLSPDGQRVIASRERAGGGDLWLLEVARGGIATRVTSRPALSTYPIWSPDGRSTVFASDSPLNLFRKNWNDAGNEQRLTKAPQLHFPMDWSRDGAWIITYEGGSFDTGRNISILSTATGDGTLKPYLHTPFSEWWARFSPEPSPRWLAYQSDESGRNEVYIDAFPTPKGRTQISTGGGQFPQWDPGGRELFYVSPDYRLMAVSLTIGSDSVEPSAPRELFRLPAVDTGRSPYDTVDGQRFLVRAVPQQAPQLLTMIVNWPVLLGNAASK